ncbi:MAG: glycerate kinase, partial [Dehalococcoidia bacterium]|nr:glycerate kinase [Dehalococcoidia bacterium]
LVVTGEGSLDAQTAHGKAVAQVVALATAAGIPCLAVAGRVLVRPSGIADAEPLSTVDGDPMRDAARLAADAAERLARRFETA